ncbi:hypothetical protein N0B51_03470 [Tsuneonella sp. YG55]|uniref:DUF883 domain-containing protein n=1 Tax=Tsuneonella litorea TaxID=2976475 RepID=A0A9X3AK85_9SPHN|nr:hypothetical protein [Tsuneonella litorea]MCT2558034.1 hypothetical protein [Tsuneonella litorea]
MATNSEDKRKELKKKIEAAEQRNSDRSFGDYARDAADGATSFVKEHPLATLAGGLALGVLVAAIVPGPGRRMRKKASARTAVLAGTLADLALTYGAKFLESAEEAAKAGQERIGDLGETIGDGARDLGRSASDSASRAIDSASRTANRALGSARSRLH